MSGASAVASARRRRADPTPQNITTQTSQLGRSEQARNAEELKTKQMSTPLQILQEHDRKIKTLEESLEEKIVEISKKIFPKNLKHLNLDKSPSPVKEFDSKPLLDKISNLLYQFDELKTQVIFQLDELKTQGIKSIQISNESNIEMLKNKDKVLGLEEKFLHLEHKIKVAEENNENIFNMDENGAAEMLLRSMMQSSVINTNDDNKLNIHENESDDELNNIGQISEITLTEKEIDTIKSEVQAVITEENVQTYDLLPDDKIEVSEDNEPILLKKNEQEVEEENENEKQVEQARQSDTK